MKPPRRLLDGPITPDERRALNAGLSLAAPAANKQRIWASVSAGLGTGVTVAAAKVASGGSGSLATSQLGSPVAHALTGAAPLAGAGAAAGKAAPLGLTLVKTLVTWALVGTGLGVGAKLALDQAPKFGATPTQAPTTAPPTQAPAATPTSPANTRGTLLVPPSTGDSAQGKPSDAQQRTLGPTSSSSSKPAAPPVPPAVEEDRQSLALERESRLVAQARTQLRSGKPRECLNALAQVDSQFPQGWLQQERRALAIEARRALGQHAEARQLAGDFVSDYPDSPYASKVSEMAR